jgi:hypothetical protein
VLVKRSKIRVESIKRALLDLCVKGGILARGFLVNSQDTRTSLLITGNYMDLIAKATAYSSSSS